MKRRLVTVFAVFFGIICQTQGQGNIAINQPSSDGRKSVSAARSIALTNTLMPLTLGIAGVELFENNTVQSVGAVMAAYGIIVGPSTGNFYAQDSGRGAAGIAGRAVGAFLMVDATREIFGDKYADAINIDDEEVSLTDTKRLIGGALILGGIVYNYMSARASVRDYNNRQRRFSMKVTPSIINDQVAPMLTARINL